MSVYSMDSLEAGNKISPRNQDRTSANTDEPNFQSNKIAIDLSYDPVFHLQPISPSHTAKKDTGSNETTPGIGTDKGAGTASGRNAIIANRRLADAPKRQRPASSRNGKRDVTDRLKRNAWEDPNKQEEGDRRNKRVAVRSSKRFLKTIPVKRSSSSKENLMPTKPDEKHGSAHGPIQQARKPRSYLERLRRKFNGPRCNVRSPEGSTLSVYGDSERKRLIDDIQSFAMPRDDQSELSFYRRIIKGSTEPPISVSGVEDTEDQRTIKDTKSISTCRIRIKRRKSEDKSKSLGYRPYTIEEYKTLPIPKLDRSLGPDKVEMQAKREWLMRRRSYGNSVSARNRQRILLQAHRLKSEDAAAEKCFLPPLKEQEVDAKTHVDSRSVTVSEDQETGRKNKPETRGGRCKKYRNSWKMPSAKKSKKLERAASCSSLFGSNDIVDDTYLESLRKRHDYEKQTVERMIGQAL